MSDLTPEEVAETNAAITRAFDLARRIIDDPSLLDTIPDGATIDIDEDGTVHVIEEPGDDSDR